MSIRCLMFLALLMTAGFQRAGAADAPDTTWLTPGTAELNASTLQPFTAKYRMARGGEYWATAVIDLRAAVVDGQPALRHGYSMYFRQQTVYDETLFLRSTMEPLMKFIHGGLPPEIAYSLYTFCGNRLTGTTVFADGREPLKLGQVFDTPVFGAGTDYLVLSVLPLKTGYSAILLSADESGVHPNAIRVEGRETLKIDGTTYETWIVAAQGGTARRWISRQAPYLIRMEVPGAKITWELTGVVRPEALHDDSGFDVQH